VLAIYDQTGEPRLWLDDDKVLDGRGQVLGWREQDALYSDRGTFVGWIIDGWLCDRDGEPVGFTESATGGPHKPLARQGQEPHAAYGGSRPYLSGAPYSPRVGYSWSRVTPAVLFA
jgi:hypothetical protein